MEIKQVFSASDDHIDLQQGRFKFCPFCGSSLELKTKDGKDRPVCLNCGFVQYRNPAPGVVVVIEKEGHVLLGKRRGSYGNGKWGLPQGYIEYGEEFLSAAKREVKEETGLEVEIQTIINVVSNKLSASLYTLAIVLLAQIKSGELQAGDDLEVLQWVPMAGPLPEMAFAADEHIIARCNEVQCKDGLPVDPRYS